MTQSNIALITDSTAALPDEIRQRYDVLIVPTMLHWGAQSYRDGVDISPQAFFERLKTDPVHPTTSAFSIGSAQEIYRQAATGHASVLGLHISSKLSGVYEIAQQARDLMPDLTVKIVDTRVTAMALGFVIQQVGEACEAGASLDEAAALAQAMIPNAGILLSPEVLTYLQRGGRIGAAAAMVGGLLDLKPILDLQDGMLKPLERVRSRKKALARMVDVAVERLTGKTKVRLGGVHANAEDEARAVAQAAAERLGSAVVQTTVCPVSPTVGAHIGPGTVGLCYTWGF
ncbi:MAG: DegV family protein [Anaerolineales bacterium]|nr:DegV family protein [Anaerolineales bacterium]